MKGQFLMHNTFRFSIALDQKIDTDYLLFCCIVKAP